MDINISEWTLLSERLFSKNYISPDQKWLMKYYTRLAAEDRAVLEQEQEISRAVAELGIPTPKTGGVIELPDGSFGALFENVVAKKSLSRAASEDLSRIPEMMRRFSDIGKTIHSTHCDTAKFPAMEDLIRRNLTRAEIYTEEEIRKILDFLDTVPKTDTCLHGDFHPGNFITSPAGDYAIDLGMFSYGNPIYDWVQWYFLSHIIPAENAEQVFHMTKEKVLDCWKLSLQYSFGYETEEEIGRFEQSLEPFLGFASVIYLDIIPMAKPTLLRLKQHCSLFR